MPLPIADRRISQLYRTLETTNGKIDDAQALNILAEVADRSGLSAAKANQTLGTMTRDQQLAAIKRGMTAGEKADLVKILDQGSVKLDASARSFFEAVLGRPVQPPPPPVVPADGNLRVTGDQSNGLTGTARPGDQIEAINLSASPTGRLHTDDTTVIATADADGRFNAAKLTGDQAIKEGDLIRMRARHADGTTGDWVTVRATGLGRDSRNAEVAIFRIGLTENAGLIDVSNINASRQISEPGAKLQFTNARTGAKTVVTLNAEGSFDPGVKLQGKAGDTFNVAATDGTNNTDFALTVGKLQVPGADGAGTVDLIKDPALHRDELDASGEPRFSTKRFTGALFKDGVSMEDPIQGQIGDCYFPSAVAAIAYQNPQALEDAIADNGDGTYTVTFKERDWRSGSGFRDVKITVDGDLYARSWGGPLYGSSRGDKGEKTMELWFPVLEKAYAQWKGSYNAIGDGGHSDVVMQELLGRTGTSMGVREGNEAAVFAQIKKSLDGKQPVSAGTYGETQAARYTNTGVYANHSYSVIGYRTADDGTQLVKLRNPWGESEPAGNGSNDGIFELDIKTFNKLYQNLMYTTP
ncbi:MAG: hypothetical protein JNK82_30110 [Myxococcaceae bacterium]|nr:hypothetical protein [Myxococcaceae bacterium]